MEKNRIIKFRGYCEDMNEWVYGGLIHITKDYLEKENLYHIDRDDYYIVDEEGTQFPITNKETIGQYTGLKDKNGVEIYEGDILPFRMYDGKIENYYIIFRDCGFDAINKDDSNYILHTIWNESEVIGNIRDNPELLEEE